MTMTLDSSFPKCSVSFSLSIFHGLKINVATGWWSARKYKLRDITSVVELDAETFRSGGKAAAGAIIGGVLTGGVGLIAGAAIGGRKRKSASYLIRFSDGEYVVVTETRRDIINIFDRRFIQQARAQELIAQQAG